MPSLTPREPVRESGTRAQIIDVAGRLFLTAGYKGTSVRDIAREVDLTVPAIYHHFINKEGLLVAVVSPVMVEMDALLVRHEGHDLVPQEPSEVLGEVFDVLSRAGAPVERLLSDPAVFALPRVGGRAQQQSQRLRRLLTGPDASRRTHYLVSCALGAIYAAARDLSFLGLRGHSATEEARATAVLAARAILELR